MTFGEQNSLSQSFGLLTQAFHSGINFFDSAEMYVLFPLLLFLLGFLCLICYHFWLLFETRYPVPQRADTQGKSEEYVGRWIRENNIPRDRIVLATKVYFPFHSLLFVSRSFEFCGFGFSRFYYLIEYLEYN